MLKLEGYESGPACIPNIGPNERRRRMIMGIVTLIISAAIAIFLIASASAWWTRLFLFLPLYGGFVGIFQAREKT